jgi:hypothetical protein
MMGRMSATILSPGSLANHTRLLQEAIDRVAADGGGTIVLEPGVYRTGTVHLRSNLHLQLAWGAVWQGSDRLADYERLQSPIASRMDSQPWAVFISAVGVRNILIEGPGTIDGNGAAPCFQTGYDNDPRRPYAIHAIGVEDITLRNLTLRDSAFWMQRYHGCERVRLHGLTVWNHANINSDGMDLDGCTDVTVSDCVLDVADDGICLKSEGALATRNVVVTNCRVGTFASAFKLGTGSLTGFENIAVSNCIFHTSRSRRMVHTLNIWNGISAIDLGSVDGGYLRQVSVGNCMIDGFENLFNLRLSARHSRDLLGGQGYGEPGVDDRPLRHHTGVGLPPVQPGTLERVLLSGITARNTGPIAANIIGYAGHPVRGVTLRDLDVQLARPGVPEDITEAPNYGDRLYPCAIAYTSIQPGVWPPVRWHGLPAYGLVLRHAEDIAVHQVRFTPAAGDPRPELHLDTGVARVTRDGRLLMP